jgi:hypothetical protein
MPGLGDPGPKSAAFYFVSVASLDDAPNEDIAKGPVRLLDGKHDLTDRAPEDPRFM